MSTPEQISTLFNTVIQLLMRKDKQDWNQTANQYVMDTFGSPNLIHFTQSADEDQKKTFSKNVLEAIKLGNKSLLVPHPVSGDVKVEEEPKAKEKEAPKATEDLLGKPKVEKKPPVKKAITMKTEKTGDTLTDLIIDKITPALEQFISEHQVGEGMVHGVIDDMFTEEKRLLRKKVDDYLADIPPRDTVRVIRGEKVTETKGRQHYKFPMLMRVVDNNIPAFLVGPAGTGKSTAAINIAKILSLDYEIISVGPQTSKGDLFGYKDANGTYHETGLVRAYRDGKLLLMDEIDAAHPGVLTMINFMMSNGKIATPGGTFQRHEEFRFIAAANTFGTGANRHYVGRNHLDAATLDRFAFIEWGIDEGLEASLIGIDEPSTPFLWEQSKDHGGQVTPKEWLELCRKTRAACVKSGLRHIISPRAVLYGNTLLSAGVHRTRVIEMLIEKGLDKADMVKLIA